MPLQGLAAMHLEGSARVKQFQLTSCDGDRSVSFDTDVQRKRINPRIAKTNHFHMKSRRQAEPSETRDLLSHIAFSKLFS